MRQTLALVWLALLLLFACGCAAKRPVKAPEPPVGTWRFTRCAQNGATWVCDCSRWHVLLNAKGGGEVRVCD